MTNTLSTLGLCLLVHVTLVAQSELQLNLISSYRTNIFNGNAATKAAYDSASRRLFFANRNERKLEALDISDPSEPVKVLEVDLTSFEGDPTDIAVSENILAVAISKYDSLVRGKVILLDIDGNITNEILVGFHPQSIAFSVNADQLLVANKGINLDTSIINPDGSVSIIDLSEGRDSIEVVEVAFGNWDQERSSLVSDGVRFLEDPKISVTQQLEPNSVTLATINTQAFVSLQRNNAFATIDLDEGRVIDIQSFGVKDFTSGAVSLTTKNLNDAIGGWPTLGQPIYGTNQAVIGLGGFAGLYFDASESTNESYIFYAIADRGPRLNAIDKDSVDQEGAPVDIRPFQLPDFTPYFIRFSLNPSTNEIDLDEPVKLRRPILDVQGFPKDTVFISGKGNIIGYDEIPVTIAEDDTPYFIRDFSFSGTSYTELPYDPFGADFGGITKDAEGHFWMCDKYRPSLYKFDSTGLMIERYVPIGASQLGVIALYPGVYGKEVLPQPYNNRQQGGGFDALAYDSTSNLLYVFLQRPLKNPESLPDEFARLVRILAIEPETGRPVEEYIYPLAQIRESEIEVGQIFRIGDATALGNGKFLVVEYDNSFTSDGRKPIFEIDLTGATNTIDLPISLKTRSDGPDDPTLEMLTLETLKTMEIRPVAKRKILNLPALGYLPNDKPTGLAALPQGELAILNNNDFGTASNGISDENLLGIVHFGKNFALDASDQDGQINIINHPVYGLYQPSVIKAFDHDGKQFIATANEGSADNHAVVRVQDTPLDNHAFLDTATLNQPEVLGRLKVSRVEGDLDKDGDLDQLITFGGRSFSIFDPNGNLVFDSGDDFEQITAATFPAAFNSDYDDNNTFDSRSDDRGPEPNSIDIAMIAGRRYSFIGLGRIGGVMVYDITNPRSPEFIKYVNNRNFLAEIDAADAGDLGLSDLHLIGEEESPTGMPILITINKISGTISFFSTEVVTSQKNTQFDQPVKWQIFPNPVQQTIRSNLLSTYTILDLLGRPLLELERTNRINVASLPRGTYILKEQESGLSKLFVKVE